MTQEDNLENQIQKQKGCMTPLLQIFYRHQILTGKKSHATKYLTSSTVADISGNENSDTASSDVSEEVSKLQIPKRPVPSPKLAQPSPVFDFKEGTKPSWKLKETSRLSLDSRATYDVKGNIQMKEIRADRLILQSRPTEDDDDNQKSRSSTSVIATLMGLEPFSQVDPPELRRCSLESRFTTDLFHHCFVYENHDLSSVNNSQKERVAGVPKNGGESRRLKKVTNSSQKQRRRLFETEEAFPEPPQKKGTSVSGKMEKKLKMRGIEEVTKDLDRLKEILEAWQLKGLLHSKSHEDEQHIDYKHVVHDRMDPESPSYSRASPRWERNVRIPIRNRGLSLTTGSKVNERRSTSTVKQKSLTVETQRQVNGSAEKSPRGSPRRIGSNQVVENGSPRNRKKATAEIYQKEKTSTVMVPDDQFSYVCGSSLSTTSDNERLKVMEWKEGRSLLERCDKLLKSIGEMNATEQQSQQSSPVSVLDSSSYESAVLPSPIMKRTIHFKENSDVEEEEGRGLLLSNHPDLLEDADDDYDLLYISEILRTYNSYFPRDCDIFTLLEKQQCVKGEDTSNKALRLRRRLIFDMVNEMLERHRRLPPWKALSQLPLEKIWSEFRRIRGSDNDRGVDLVATVCAVVKKDLGGDEWEECSVEFSAVILDIERMIFKDLVTESIGDLAILACQNSFFVAPCRRLVF